MQGISEAFLLPVLEFILSQFPFVIKGFHSDNGSVDLWFCQYVNKNIAAMLNKLNIEQTKSRARQSNDNALAESKNNSVVRKHMGYSHIGAKVCQTDQRVLRQHLQLVAQHAPAMLICHRGSE